jgi:hypothetical protein
MRRNLQRRTKPIPAIVAMAIAVIKIGSKVNIKLRRTPVQILRKDSVGPRSVPEGC